MHKVQHQRVNTHTLYPTRFWEGVLKWWSHNSGGSITSSSSSPTNYSTAVPASALMMYRHHHKFYQHHISRVDDAARRAKLETVCMIDRSHSACVVYTHRPCTKLHIIWSTNQLTILLFLDYVKSEWCRCWWVCSRLCTINPWTLFVSMCDQYVIVRFFGTVSRRSIGLDYGGHTTNCVMAQWFNGSYVLCAYENISLSYTVATRM